MPACRRSSPFIPGSSIRSILRWRAWIPSFGSSTSTTCAVCRTGSSAGSPPTASSLSRTSCRGSPLEAFPAFMTSGPVPPFLFPGQLAEFVGMGRDFHEADPRARELFALTSEKCGMDLARILFSGPEATLRGNLPAQAGVYLVSTLGDSAAVVAAGAISYEEGVDILIAVWRETERLGIRGAMGAVVGARREAVDAACEELRGRGLPGRIGNVNSSTQFVLTGSEPAVRAALESLAPRALSVLPLTMSWPIHSEMMR